MIRLVTLQEALADRTREPCRIDLGKVHIGVTALGATSRSNHNANPGRLLAWCMQIIGEVEVRGEIQRPS